MHSNQIANLHWQTAQIAIEIDRTRALCARSMELLRLSVPSTFLGRKLEPLPDEERRHLRLEIADYLHSKETA